MRCKDWNIKECDGCVYIEKHPVSFADPGIPDKDICWVANYINCLAEMDETAIKQFFRYFIKNRTHIVYIKSAIDIQFPQYKEMFDKLVILL